MTLILEDGTGVPNANSYVSIVEADQYFTDTGRSTEWGSLFLPEREAALVNGTLYVEQLYSQSFQGVRLSRSQGLSWPRSGVILDCEEISEDEIPIELRRAVMEYSLTASSSTLLPDPGPQSVTLTRKKVGPIETETEFTDSGSEVIQSRPAGDTWITPLLKSVQKRAVR